MFIKIRNLVHFQGVMRSLGYAARQIALIFIILSFPAKTIFTFLYNEYAEI